MIDIELTIRVEKGKVTFPYQNEVENLALETIGTQDNIYFEPTPLTDEFYVEREEGYDGWVLKVIK